MLLNLICLRGREAECGRKKDRECIYIDVSFQGGFPSDLDDTVAVTLTFPKNRVAQFIVSYYGNSIDEYTIVGTKGSCHMSPAFMHSVGLEYSPIMIGEKRKFESFKTTDHFAGECEYFSECILKVRRRSLL